MTWIAAFAGMTLGRHGEEETGSRSGQGRRRRRRAARQGRPLCRACAQVPPLLLRGPDRPGRHGDDAQERVRHRPHRAGLHADRRARRRQDHDRAHPLARAQLRARRRRQADLRHGRVRPPLRRDHGGPAPRRAGDGRRLQHRRRQHARDHRERALQAADGALQGLPHRRGAHALQGRLQRAPEDAGGAAGAREVHLRHHRGAQGAAHRAVALPALRSAARRGARADRALQEDRRQRGRRGRGRGAGRHRPRRRRLGARRALAARPGAGHERRDRAARSACATCWASPTAAASSTCSSGCWRADRRGAGDVRRPASRRRRARPDPGRPRRGRAHHHARQDAGRRQRGRGPLGRGAAPRRGAGRAAVGGDPGARLAAAAQGPGRACPRAQPGGRRGDGADPPGLYRRLAGARRYHQRARRQRPARRGQARARARREAARRRRAGRRAGDAPARTRA